MAASARQRGLDVTSIDPASVPLERALGAEPGAVYRDIHADHGVPMLRLCVSLALSPRTSAVSQPRLRAWTRYWLNSSPGFS